MIKRLLTGLVEWLSDPIAGDRVVVVEPIRLGAAVIPCGAIGFVGESTAFGGPSKPIGRVRFDVPQPGLGDAGNALDVWPSDSPSGSVTWRQFKTLPRF